MARSAYTRLYATSSGALLVLLGLAGMAENAEFADPVLWSKLLGIYATNGWANAAHILLGLSALLMAQRASRIWALVASVLFLGLGIWGVVAPAGDLLFGLFPATRAVNALNLLLGLLAAAALVASRWEEIKAAASNREERLRKRRIERKKKQQEELRKKRVGQSRKTTRPSDSRRTR